MSRRASHVIVATVVALWGSVMFDARPTLGGVQAAAPEAPTTSAITDVVTYSPPITIGFVGPARFAGVTFNASGSVVTTQKWFGTIVRVDGLADQSQVVNGLAYAHVVEGPLSGLWVRVNDARTQARGRTPPPPPCRYDDVLTSRRSYVKFAITLLDTTYKLGSSYVPPDLRDTANYGLNTGYRVRALMGAELEAMARAAKAAGAPIQLVSAYRSYAQQAATFNYWVSVSGYQQALLTSARAGHSEHQLGTTIDVTSKGGAAPWTYADWVTTPAGAWMRQHAWKYGFVMSYPKNRTALTCYSYEPWHYRYVGRPIASVLRDTGMTLREAIWVAYGP